MKNKHTIKKESKSGSFTTISYSILRDNRLSSNAKILIIELLSDSDDMKLSPTIYCNRQGWDVKQYKRAFAELLACGYIRRKDIAKTLTEYLVRLTHYRAA